MSTRTERDKQKALQERHQAILSKLLKDEDNKYCVDCDAKGPRWASWNLGIFLCIRCAGIHRNLGVHISKVKSVNLDTWTPEQIAMMEEMGNSRARAVYEANLPDHVRRPQSDSSLEAFIRAKYEQKKYIAKEWIPPKPKIPQYSYDEFGDIVDKPVKTKKSSVLEEPRKEKKKPRAKQATLQLGVPQNKSSVSRKTESAVERPTANKVEITQKKNNIDDLLGLDDPPPVSSNGLNSNDIIFDSFVQAPSTITQSAATAAPTPQQPEQGGASIPSSSSAGLVSELFSEDSKEPAKNTKDSIMALFGPQQQQQQQAANNQMFGVPGGMYIQQPQMNMMNMQNMQNGGMMSNMMNPGIMQNNMMQQQQTPNMQGGMMMGGSGMQQNAMGGGMMPGQQQVHMMMQQQQQPQNMYNMGAFMQQQQQPQQPHMNQFFY